MLLISQKTERFRWYKIHSDNELYKSVVFSGILPEIVRDYNKLLAAYDAFNEGLESDLSFEEQKLLEQKIGFDGDWFRVDDPREKAVVLKELAQTGVPISMVNRMLFFADTVNLDRHGNEHNR